MANVMQEPLIDTICENCGYGTWQVPASEQKWHVTCDECNAIQMVYDPLPHQVTFHQDTHKYKMFAGGYGSGKTTTACMETVDHILSTPGGATLIGAASLPQLEQTAMKEFFEVFPQELIPKNGYNRQKNYLDTVNGHRVIFRPLDEEQKARSLNLTFFWIEEANGVGFSYFTQLQTRLRNDATDFHRGIVSTNPDQNWVRTELLLKSDVIYNADEDYPQKEDEIDVGISTHIAPTHLNIHLPETYYEDTSRGKPEWWIRRYLHGSFINKEGLVYPNYKTIPDFEIPDFWHRRVGGDFGLNNPTGFAALATDPETGKSYIYWVHKESHKPVSHHAAILQEHLDTLAYNVIQSMVGDSQGQAKTHGDLSSTFDHYAEYGIYWQPGTKKLEDSIQKVYSYFDLDKLYIFESCVELIEEVSTYKYPERSLDKEVKNEDIYERPVAVNDHLLDGVRYMVAEMPDDPSLLINKSYNAQHMIHNNRLQKTKLPHALQDNKPSYSRNDSWMAY